LIEWKPLTQQSRVEIGRTFTEIFKDVEDVHEIVNVGNDTSEEGKGDLETGDDDPVHSFGGGDFILEDYLGDSFLKKNLKKIQLEEEPQTPRWGVLNLTWQNFMTMLLLLKARCQVQ